MVETRRPGAKPKTQRHGSPGAMAAQQAAERAEAEKHPGLLARLAAALILQDIVAKGHTLEERFSTSAVPSRLQSLEPRDRALVRSIVTAALRRLGTLRGAIAKRLENGLPRQAPEIEWTLVVGAAQIVLLDVPDHAAVDLAVRAVRLDRQAPRRSPRSSMPCCATSRAPATRSWLRATRSTATCRAGSPQRWRKTYGEATAQAPSARRSGEEPTLDISVKGRRGRLGRTARRPAAADGIDPPRDAQAAIEYAARAMTRARGGCRTPPPRSRRRS